MNTGASVTWVAVTTSVEFDIYQNLQTSMCHVYALYHMQFTSIILLNFSEAIHSNTSCTLSC